MEFFVPVLFLGVVGFAVVLLTGPSSLSSKSQRNAEAQTAAREV